MNKDKTWKIVKSNGVNSDQELLGFFNSEQHAKDSIPYIFRKHSNWIKDKNQLIVKPVYPEKIFMPVCTDYMHYVRSLIPDGDWVRVMQSDSSAEIHASSLMCGSATYYYLSRMIPKHWTVVDIGCSYNAQSYLFQKHARHIAIEPLWLDREFHFEYFKAPNTELLFMAGQDFIEKELPKLNLDMNKTFCIVNYVPSGAVNLMARETFRNLYTFYPA